MFISLVAQANDTPLSGVRFDQRFNVSTSRARDRAYLVRSVDIDQLRASDQLRRALLDHFRMPFPAEGREAKNRRDRCESPFEIEMYDLLVDRGYRVDTQVKVGDFRIDLVVEGENDRRVAIECDGDRYHGPDRWAADMARQRILERAGWTVWRCFASRFVRYQDQVIDELTAFLRERGIEPVGRTEAWVSRHVELRHWRTPDVDDDLSQDSSSIIPDPIEHADNGVGAVLKPEETVDEGQTSTLVRVTEPQVQEAILSLMSDGRTWSNAELKHALPERLPLSSADRERATFRPNEEKWEELVNNALSPSRGNSLPARGLVVSRGRGLHQIAASTETLDLAPEETPEPSTDESDFLPPIYEVGQEYRFADITVAHYEGDLIYDEAYHPRLQALVAEVIEREAPVYLELVVERVARAHGKQKAGRIIHERVVSAIPHPCRRSTEGDRVVLFGTGADPNQLVALRPSKSDWRSHRDTPLVELASLALPLVRANKTDDEILAHYAKSFKLARLRQPTRVRFEQAIAIARAVQQPKSP